MSDRDVAVIRAILLAAGVAFVALVGVVVAKAQPAGKAQPVWRSQCYGTFDGMVAGMNRLYPHQWESIQIVTVPSSRNVLGWAGDPYCLIYRQ